MQVGTHGSWPEWLWRIRAAVRLVGGVVAEIGGDAFEGTLLHARNVLEFVKKGPNAQTRSAPMFNPNWDHKAAKTRVEALYADICTALSHIGFGRGSFSWDPLKVADIALCEYEDAVSGATAGDVALLEEGAVIARAAVERARAQCSQP